MDHSAPHTATLTPTATAERRGPARTAAVLLAAAAAMLVTLVAPAPASAAGSTTRPDVSACFAWGGTTYAGQPAYLQVWNGSTWVTQRSATTGSTGCIRFNDLAPDRYYTITGYRFFGYPNCYYYYGQAPWTRTYANDALHRLSTAASPTRVGGPHYVSC
ncbi:MAG: hypothetical protein ACLGIG_07375 [Actinomycetes bacterium]